MSKLWAGRTVGATDKTANDFHSSIRFDARLYRQDIQGSIAHAKMLGKQGILAQDDVEAIVNGLCELLADIENGKIEFSPDAEDIHMNVETLLTQRIGDAGKRLHTARSRNDQVATDTRKYVKTAIDELDGQLKALLSALCNKAEQHLHTLMPGFTHLQHAQPVTFAHHLMAYAEMFRRDIERLQDCRKRVDVCPLGSGAMATTTYPIDRVATAAELGFAKISQNSQDAVSDRDYCIELCACLSIVMMHLSRFCEEIILWCSSEFSYIELDDAYSTGSSIMPQKKNPDMAELIRGKSGRVYGDLMALLTMMKALPLAYNKDMQEDKEATFDAIDTTMLCLEVFAPMLATMRVNVEVMRAACDKGYMNATDCADFLVRKGLPFRDAYKIVGELVAKCIELDVTLDNLPLAEYQAASPLFDESLVQAITPEQCVAGRNAPGGPAPEAVERHIKAVRGVL
ncbi:MAG: argininosuccinate lyase [Oscillospiraceae bacterium]|nr:argininosuccinate lyase [Oscillospiraceae bacterium]